MKFITVGRIYTGTEDGTLVEIRNGQIYRDIRLTNRPCGRTNLICNLIQTGGKWGFCLSMIRFKAGNKVSGSYELEPTCGRPLGIRRLNENEIVVADAYLGIYAVNFKKSKSF